MVRGLTTWSREVSKSRDRLVLLFVKLFILTRGADADPPVIFQNDRTSPWFFEISFGFVSFSYIISKTNHTGSWHTMDIIREFTLRKLIRGARHTVTPMCILRPMCCYHHICRFGKLYRLVMESSQCAPDILRSVFPNNSLGTVIARPLGRHMGDFREILFWPTFYLRILVYSVRYCVICYRDIPRVYSTTQDYISRMKSRLVSDYSVNLLCVFT